MRVVSFVRCQNRKRRGDCGTCLVLLDRIGQYPRVGISDQSPCVKMQATKVHDTLANALLRRGFEMGEDVYKTPRSLLNVVRSLTISPIPRLVQDIEHSTFHQSTECLHLCLFPNLCKRVLMPPRSNMSSSAPLVFGFLRPSSAPWPLAAKSGRIGQWKKKRD